MKIMNEKVLCLKWSEVVRKFSLSMAHAYENYTLRALLDASEMTVDGMKEKWLDVLILDTLVSMFQWSPQEIEKFELHRRRKFDQYYFFKAAVIDTVSEQMVESLLCPSSIPVSLASYIEIVDISLEWDSFDAFIKKVSVDQSHRSWCRRHEAAQRLQKIISERGESISSIIISVVNSIYTDVSLKLEMYVLLISPVVF